MREIKFRAWDKDTKQMHEVIQIDFKNWIAIPVPQRDEDGDVYWILEQKRIQEVELMQFTGLKDKNGTEIYEGDIVIIEDYYENVRIGIIVFDSGTYKLQNLGQSFYYEFGSDGEYDWDSIENVDEDNIEILGNLYENPELLKGGEEV